MKPKRAIDEAAKAQREQDILYAALSLFAEQGFHATKMTDIAAKIGLSKGTLYLYFANKENLFRALITRFAATEMMRMIALLDGEEDIDRALVLLYEEMIVILRDSPLPKLIRVLISEAALFPEMVAFYRDHIISRAHAGLSARLGGDAQAQTLAQLVLAPFILSVLSQEIIFPDQPFDEVALRRMMDTQLSMITNHLHHRPAQ